MAKPIYVLNGPNLNLLGKREPAVYGHESLDDVRARTEARAKAVGLTIEFRQSNDEGELVNWIQELDCESDVFWAAEGTHGKTDLRPQRTQP